VDSKSWLGALTLKVPFNDQGVAGSRALDLLRLRACRGQGP
jgi:hypothetical protein